MKDSCSNCKYCSGGEWAGLYICSFDGAESDLTDDTGKCLDWEEVAKQVVDKLRESDTYE